MGNRKLLVLVIIFLGCENIVYRMSKDYFPLKTTNRWEYENTEGNLRVIEVTEDSVVGEFPCKIVLNNFKPEFWYKDEEKVKKFTVKTINIDGEDYTLEEEYRTYYLLPFIKDNTWGDSLKNTLEVYGDSIFFTHQIEGEVLDIEDMVSVPAGDFYEVYKLKIKETFTLNDSTWEDTSYEWYAPGIGLIKRRYGPELIFAKEEVLKKYSIR